MATSSSETLSPTKATLSWPATGRRKLFTSSSERRCSSPVKHALVSSTVWKKRPLSPCQLWFISTWGARRLWPSGAELRFSGLQTERCLSVTWRRPLVPSSDHHPATAISCPVSRGCVREGQNTVTICIQVFNWQTQKLSLNTPHVCGPRKQILSQGPSREGPSLGVLILDFVLYSPLLYCLALPFARTITWKRGLPCPASLCSPASIHKGATVNREQDERPRATAGESSISTPYNSESPLKPSSQL